MTEPASTSSSTQRLSQDGGESPALPPRVLRLDDTDNVAVALLPLRPGELLMLGQGNGELVVSEEIGFGHKVALVPIARGGVVRKYGEVIGVATAPIAPGCHVHIHNVVSARLPGSDAEHSAELDGRR
ncbi:MAG: galactonate dehydratase [Acidimicrobiaceae bacterium]|nr:galactonate dehydratase [Acidimicrobiaceae bacterium]